MIVTSIVANVSPANHPSPLHHKQPYFIASLMGNPGCGHFTNSLITIYYIVVVQGYIFHKVGRGYPTF